MKLSTGYRHFEVYFVYPVLEARIPDDLAQVLWKRLHHLMACIPMAKCLEENGASDDI